MSLTKTEFDIIEKIVGFGGYATKEILHLYKSEVEIDRCYRYLAQLELKGFLRTRAYFNSFREPLVYQVTRKACALFGRPDAYMRKVHKPYAVRRYLIRSHYLFYLAGQGTRITLFSSASREAFLKEKGFTAYYLPKKVNRNMETINIEEYILNENAINKSICFLYVDNQTYTVKGQIENLFSKYRRMEKAQLSFITFLVITEDNYRAEIFKETYNSYFYKAISLIDLEALSIERNYAAYRN